MLYRLIIVVGFLFHAGLVIAEVKPRFYYSSIGAVYNTYVSGQGKSYIDRYSSLPQFKRYATRMDVFGKYYSINNKPFLIGGMVGSEYELLISKHSRVHMSRLMFSLSSIRFLNSIGTGAFARGDFGLALFTVAHDPHAYPQTSVGINALAGLGYAFSFSKKTTLNLELQFSPAVYLNALDYTLAATIGLMY